MARRPGPGRLARLQQALTVGALGLALLWLVFWWGRGRPGLALGGAGVLVGGYALVLGLEVLMLAATHDADPTPRARGGALVRAWWAEVLSAPAVFCWRQPFRSQAWPDQIPVAAHGTRGVLFIHGFVCNRGFWNPWLAKLTAQGTPFVAVNLEPVFGSIDDTIPDVEAAVRRLEAATGLAPIVVAHSMGGLVLRRWWAEAGGAGAVCRIHHAITIGTPHQGTWLARWGHTANARQMLVDGGWLRNLVQRERSAPAGRFTCFYSHCDNIVFPPRRGTLPGADNRHLPGWAHVHMASAPEPWAELQRLLGADVRGD